MLCSLFCFLESSFAHTPAWPGGRLQVNTGRETQRLLPQCRAGSQTSQVPQAPGSRQRLCATRQHSRLWSGPVLLHPVLPSTRCRGLRHRLQIGCSDVNQLFLCSGRGDGCYDQSRKPCACTRTAFTLQSLFSAPLQSRFSSFHPKKICCALGLQRNY